MSDTQMQPDDEVIADSEDDGEMDAFPALGLGGGMNARQSSPVSGFTTASRYQQAAQSSISNFTAGPSALPDHPSRFTSLERETTKGTDAETSIASIGGAYTDFEGITSSIADRAKTRQRPTKAPAPVVLDVIELTSEDEDEEPSLKHPKPKTKPKPKPKSKPKTKATEMGKAAPFSMVPDTSMQTEQPKPPGLPRPRPRPRPRVLGPLAPADPSRDSVTSFPLTTPPSGGPELPIATSPPRAPPTSQLPPSDPPIPSISTACNDDPRARAPPIEFLADGPLSSPSSLFSENAASNKRKRAVPELDELDELATSQGIPERAQQPAHKYGSSPRGMQPPSTFFAVPPLPRDIVDLTMLPPTMVPQPKPKKAKKKKVDLSMYDGSEHNKMLVLDEDDRDDDFNPDGEGSSKKKKSKTKAKDKDKPAKNRAKPKLTTDTGDLPGKGKGKLEVVMDTRPQSKAGPKTKAVDKGKQKAVAANKEVFKSSEFIEDSEDELASINVAGFSGDIVRVLPATAPVTAPHSGKSTPLAPTTASSHKQPIQAPQRSPSPLSDWEADMPKARPSDKRASGPKKRKSTVDSEGDDDDFTGDAGDIIRVTPSASSKKRKKDETPSRDKTKSKSKSKTGKNTVISEDEQDGINGAQEEVAVKSHKPSKGTKASKKIIPDEDEDNDVDEPPKSTKAQQAAAGEILKASKENAAPAASKPTYATPAPPTRPKPTVPSTGGHTPLYARYEIAPRRSSLPMSELIRRANSIPGSPFTTPHPATPAASGSSRVKTLARPAPLVYSPLLKSSRSMLSRIASLHPNRRTPPPPRPTAAAEEDEEGARARGEVGGGDGRERRWDGGVGGARRRGAAGDPEGQVGTGVGRVG